MMVVCSYEAQGFPLCVLVRGGGGGWEGRGGGGGGGESIAINLVPLPVVCDTLVGACRFLRLRQRTASAKLVCRRVDVRVSYTVRFTRGFVSKLEYAGSRRTCFCDGGGSVPCGKTVDSTARPSAQRAETVGSIIACTQPLGFRRSGARRRGWGGGGGVK